MQEMPVIPFLKWAGGKRWLASSDFEFPDIGGKYIEPFLGSGAIFFALRPKRAVLSDVNGRLIETYEVVRDFYTDLSDLLKGHQVNHCSNYYYSVRSAEFSEKIERAAQFIYLNRTCWNGLYRENRNGKFNVPIGTKTSVLLPTDNFSEISRFLQRATLKCCDFEHTIDESAEGDVIFADPPYTTAHNLNGFTKYNQHLFSWSDQIRLKDALVRALGRGAKVVLTNADHQSVQDLYSEIGEARILNRASVISASAHARKPTTEAIYVLG